MSFTGISRSGLVASLVLGVSTACAADSDTVEQACRFTEADLVGAWSGPLESAEVVEDDRREFVFERAGDDRVFREYLHHRPMSAGTWTLDECRVVVVYPGESTEEFRLEGTDAPLLVGDPDDAEYRTEYSKLAEAAGSS